jgi:molybdate transport system substrate-binding protein
MSYLIKKTIKISIILSLVSIAFSCNKPVQSDRDLMIFTAASVRPAMDEIISEYKKAHPDAKIAATYGSTGKAYSQIIHDAPYDILFAADTETPEKLKKDGLTSGEIFPYATGRLVIWQRKGSKFDLSKGFAIFKDPQVKRISMANPDVAPYGAAAREVLKKYNLWDSLKDHIVMGENLSQAAHFASSGSADLAIIAYSQALSKELKENEGSFFLIDEKDHPALKQTFVILKKGVSHTESKPFADFMNSEAGKAVFKKHGLQ